MRVVANRSMCRRGVVGALLVFVVAWAFAGPAAGAPPENRPGRSENRDKHDTTTTTTADGADTTAEASGDATTSTTSATTTAGGKGNGKGAAATTTSTLAVEVGTTTTTEAASGAAGEAAGQVRAAAAALTIETITWDVVGLDSNNVTTGPNTYPVGVRVCATGGAVADVTVAFTWDSFNPYLNLFGPSVLSIASLADGACADRYFFVVVTRDAAAYRTTRAYHVTASAPGVPTVSTPTPRQLYVEKLLSQNRNAVLSIDGPTTVYEGDTVTYTVTASTAPNGYSQLETFLTMLGPLFQLLEVNLVYETPSGSNRSPYVDACGWDNDPTSSTYRSCVGPEKVPGGRVGGTMIGDFTGVVSGTGSTTMSNAIVDVSGGSYHYNTDFGTAPNLIGVVALPSADLALSKTAVGSFVAGETGAFGLTVTNLGPSASGTPVVITDTLPAGVTFVSGGGSGWTCSASGATVTCSTAAALAAGSSSAVTITVALADSLAGSVLNTAVVSGPGRDLTPGNNTAQATARVTSVDDVRSVDPPASRGAGAERTRTGGVDMDVSDTRLAVTGASSTGMLVALALFLIALGSAARRAAAPSRHR
ncbi:MAG: DUF11 domain-containing protein [Actinobacteria bacterium]|nr:DUF11 domain-containing protein [Actinomycetota bacterium]